MASQKARDLWKQLKDEDRENRICIECNSANPQWASVSYGIFFCLECSGVHRSLGVHLSFVRSLTMDSWSDRQLAMMQAGGNSKAKAFFKAHGIDGMGIKEKYATKAAAQFREKILAQIEGRAFEDDKKKTMPQSRTPPPSQERPKQAQRDELDDWLEEKPQRHARSAPTERRELPKKKEEIDFDWGKPSSAAPERPIQKSSDYYSSTSSRNTNSSASSYTNAPSRSNSSTQNSYNTPPPSRGYSGNSYSGGGGGGGGGGYSSGGGYNGNNTERLAQFSNARAISSSDFYGDGSDSNKSKSGKGGYNSESIVDYGFNLLTDGMSKLSAVASTAATKIGEQGREFSSKVQEKGLLTEVQDMSGKGWDYVSSVFNKAKDSVYGEENTSGARQGGGGYGGGYGGGGSGYGGGGGYNSSSSSRSEAISWDDDRHNDRQSNQSSSQRSNNSRNGNYDRDLLGDDDQLGDNTSKNSTKKANGASKNSNNTQQRDLLGDDDWGWEDSSSKKSATSNNNKQQQQQQRDDEDSGSAQQDSSNNNNNDEDEWVWKDEDNSAKNKAVRKTTATKKKPVATASTGNSDGAWDGW